MILGINGIRLVGKRSGVGRAIEAVLHCMGEMKHPFTEIRVYSPLPIDASIKLPTCAKNVVLTSRLPPGLWEQLVLLRVHGSKNVLFCPSYVSPLLARCPVLLVHHGSYEGYAQASEVFSWWTRLKARVMYHLSAQRATLVSTVSYYSKQDMMHFYRMSSDRIQVIPEGVDTQLFRPIGDTRQLAEWRRRVLGADVPFILYVGKPTKRRNLPNLLKAFQQIKQNHNLPHKLVLIGSALPGTSFKAEIQSLNLASEIIDIDYAPHKEIAMAYNACDAMIYPSSYEGFGMPVLEAMACGAPVIALNNTAFPEFAGGIAKLLPDANVETLMSGIVELLSDQERRQWMRQAGPQRAAEYDWHIVTRRYLELLVELANRHTSASLALS